MAACYAFSFSIYGTAYWNLQAPVSDREYRATLPQTAAMIDLASTMISEGRGLELMPREADEGAPITAYRWVAVWRMGVYYSLLTVKIQSSTVLIVALLLHRNHWGNGSQNILVCRILFSSLILHHLLVFRNLQCMKLCWILKLMHIEFLVGCFFIHLIYYLDIKVFCNCKTSIHHFIAAYLEARDWGKDQLVEILSYGIYYEVVSSLSY